MAITDRRAGVTEGLAIKAACYVASTTNLTLGSTQVVDGIAIGATGERILVKNQTDQKENGIYVASGATWSRARDCDGQRDIIPGTLVYVDRGTAHADTFWVFNSSSTATSIAVSNSTGDNIVLSEVSPALQGTVVATGSLTARTLPDRFADVVNVKDFGAKGDGFTNDASAFATAVAATTDGEVVVIHVPSGEYAGAIWSISIGSRQVVWLEEGDVTYQAGPPPGSRAFSTRGSNKTRPWLIGPFGAAVEDGYSSGSSDEQPVLYVYRNADHTGGTPGGNPTGQVLKVDCDVQQNVTNYETAFIAELDTYADGDSTTPPNFVAAHLVGRRKTLGASVARIYGANIVARDESGRASNVQLGGVTGCEINIRASGPDANNVRSCLALIPSEYVSSTDGATDVFSGIRITPSANLGSSGCNIKHGIIMEVETGGSVTGSFTNGVTLRGPFSGQAIEIDQPDQPGRFRVGSNASTAGSTIGTVQFAADNSTGGSVNYIELRGLINDSSAGSEDAQLVILTQQGGTLTANSRFGLGVQIGTPLGTDLGVGTVNIEGSTATNQAIGFDGGAGLYFGTGSPESAVPAAIGSLFLRTNSSTSSQTLYVKESGSSATGWIAK